MFLAVTARAAVAPDVSRLASSYGCPGNAGRRKNVTVWSKNAGAPTTL